MRKAILLAPIIFALFAGCAILHPGADPLVVRAEQAETISLATFSTFLQLDNDNRELFKAKVPEVHTFAEWLRAPVGTPPEPRGLSIVNSVDRVRLVYKSNRTTENKATLATALATLEQVLTETQARLVAAQKAKL